MAASSQNFGTFRIGFVQRQTTSTYQLGPGFYSLSSLATVPYVAFKGNQGREKTFSWGEVVEVPKGMLVTVKNASFHDGDIVINGGRDFGVVPTRLTVPVPVTIVVVEGNFVMTPDFPLDVRRARRAWVVVDAITGNVEGSFTKIGAKQQGSHDTAVSQVDGAPTSSGYGTIEALAANSVLDYLALGARTFGDEDRPMVLLDEATFTLSIDQATSILENQVYYVMDY